MSKCYWCKCLKQPDEFRPNKSSLGREDEKRNWCLKCIIKHEVVIYLNKEKLGCGYEEEVCDAMNLRYGLTQPWCI